MKNKFIFVLIILFSWIGMMVVTNYVHEMIHYKDLKPYIVEDYICLLTLDPGLTGASAFNAVKYDSNNLTQVEGVQYVQEFTEIKAYSASILIMLLWLGVFSKFTWDYMMDDLNVRYVYKKKEVK